MASIAGLRPWPRWRWAGFWQRPKAAVDHIQQEATARPELRRRFYPPQRDSFMERSAMAREMYRL